MLNIRNSLCYGYFLFSTTHIRKVKNRLQLIFLSVCIIVLSSCATYYTRNIKFQEAVADGRLDDAQKLLEKNKKEAEGRNKFLWQVNSGYVASMQANYEQSNVDFNQADFIAEDYRKNLGAEALALISNPMMKPYKPEDFEVVMINCYKAFNYLQLNDFENALVEAKRINIRLNALNDKYPNNKNRYRNDAFAQVMMGLIYDANQDYNNAFIAYRNALEIYQTDYKDLFNVTVPEQLKQDLLRTAYKTGFYSDVKKYEKMFNLKYEPSKDKANLVFFWLNGFGPVKAEWSINFTLIPGQGGMVTFANDELGLNFPFFVGNGQGNSSLSNLRFLRVAFPKYVERQPVFNQASINLDGNRYPLYKAEDINQIAFKTLQDRMLREMANSLLRLAMKKSLEMVASNENKGLGAVVSIANALTEKADTRNWQTLPYSISYTRVPLNDGENKIKLNVSGNANASHDFKITGSGSKTIFRVFHNLESYPAPISQ